MVLVRRILELSPTMRVGATLRFERGRLTEIELWPEADLANDAGGARLTTAAEALARRLGVPAPTAEPRAQAIDGTTIEASTDDGFRFTLSRR